MAKISAKMTDAQYGALSKLAWFIEVWWHDLPAGAREVLHRRHWLKEIGSERCTTKGHRHPGYVTASEAGIDALNREAARRGDSRYGLGKLPPSQLPKALPKASGRQLDHEISATLRRR